MLIPAASVKAPPNLESEQLFPFKQKQLLPQDQILKAKMKKDKLYQ